MDEKLKAAIAAALKSSRVGMLRGEICDWIKSRPEYSDINCPVDRISPLLTKMKDAGHVNRSSAFNSEQPRWTITESGKGRYVHDNDGVIITDRQPVNSIADIHQRMVSKIEELSDLKPTEAPRALPGILPGMGSDEKMPRNFGIDEIEKACAIILAEAAKLNRPPIANKDEKIALLQKFANSGLLNDADRHMAISIVDDIK